MIDVNALAQKVANSTRSHLVVLKDQISVNHFVKTISLFQKNSHTVPILTLPDRDTLPYSREFIPETVHYERLRILNELTHHKNAILITTINNICLILPPKEHIAVMFTNLECGNVIPLEKFKNDLLKLGYQLVDEVISSGDLKIIGSVMHVKLPSGLFKIEWFDDEIENIWFYKNREDKYIQYHQPLHFFSSTEISLNKTTIDTLCKYWKKIDSHAHEYSEYQFLQKGYAIECLYELTPIVFDQCTSVIDFFNQQPKIWMDKDWSSKYKLLQKNIENNFKDNQKPFHFPLPEPSKILDNTVISQKSELISTDENEQTIHISNLNNQKVIITCDTTERTENLSEQLTIKNLNNKIIHSIYEVKSKENIFILKGHSFWISKIKDYLLIPDYRLLTGKKELNTDNDPSTTLLQIEIGDYVIHEDHGFALYNGLIKLNNQEFMELIFQDQDKLYIGVESFNKITTYRTESDIKLSKLGAKSWQKTKTKAKKITYDYAAEILKIQAKKSILSGFQCKIVSEFNEFCKQFPYQETQDQLACTNEIIKDMQSNKIMDRLVCGDVGFGKTEVAMRAAFIACMNNKKVIVLSPTTVLAKQHIQSFKDRFKLWPIQLEILTRNTNKTSLIKKLINQDYDILIATHAVLKRKEIIKDVGLLIIDEEHRFGVKDKESIRKINPNIDTLSMSATPIPRSLNMALSAMRDISLIATPPVNRIQIITKVLNENDHMVLQAINREFFRGGQVYLIHNNIETISKISDYWQRKCTDAKIGILHSKLSQKEQDKVMYDFSQHHINLLITTTIVESGIDIPNANTIIISRADKFGLSQLHQLRGRVGRSNRQAYAYLLTPNLNYLKNKAKSRLNAISVLQSMGSGYHIAVQDLEIRGGGSLLGKEQSGVIEGIGYDLYINMLNQACKTLNIGEIENNKPSFVCDFSISIPSSYIDNTNERLEIYQKIANSESFTELNAICDRLNYLYGALPLNVSNLFKVNELAIKLKSYFISEFKIKKNRVEACIDVNKIKEEEFHKKLMKEFENIKFLPNSIISFNYRFN